MKKKLSKIMIFIGIFSLIIGTFNILAMTEAYAINLQIIGDQDGLEVIPSGTRLFDLGNLNPGDTKEEKIDIKNNYTSPFKVYMRTERRSPQPQIGEADLFKQLILTVYLDNVQIYSGSMKDYAPSNISLGDFNPNTGKELRAVVHLPGRETGNEFQGKSLTVNWYFIAQLDDSEEPETPGTPTTPITPTTPTTPTTPIRPGQTVPSTEEAVEEMEEIDQEIPEGAPQVTEPKDEPEMEIIEEETPLSVPESPQEVKTPDTEYEEIEVDIPQAQAKMPKTGQVPALIYYGFGTAFIGLGIKIGRKKEK